MKMFIVALLVAISYAQTVDLSMLMPCEGRSTETCKGHSVDGFCRMNYNKVPPRCEDGDPMDSEDICASLQEDACKSKQGCCWNLRESFMGRCVPFEMDVEDCPSILPRIFPAMAGAAATSGDATADQTGGDATADQTGDATADQTGGDAGADAGTSGDASATGDATADQTGGASSGSASSYPFMTPNPPMADRTLAMMGCETSGLAGPSVCNNLKAGSPFNPKVCGWNVKEGGCEEIELGKGNLCKTVADQDTCNQQGDCCWDMKGYCGEFDFGDCARPGMGNMNLPTINIGGMTIVPGMEEHMEAQSEMAEAHAEAAENHAEMMGEMTMGGMYEPEIEYEELLPVQTCDGLPFCHGRVGMNPCILNAQQKCVQMTMPTMPGAPVLRKGHESKSSSPFNYGHLLMVLGGGLIVGLAAGMCFQNFRSKSSIAPVLLEDNYRNI